MRELYAKTVLIVSDIAVIFLSTSLAYEFRLLFGDSLGNNFTHHLSLYTNFLPIYMPILLFMYEGVYTKRYDFWHESREIIRSLIFSFVMVMAYLALTKSIESYSRFTITSSFIFMMFLFPIEKLVMKRVLFRLKLWAKGATIYGDDPFLYKEIFGNHYLGYVYEKDAKTIFINSTRADRDSLYEIIDMEILKTHEVIFIPLINEYNLTQSTIYYLFNTHTNLIVFTNRLKSLYRKVIKYSFDFIISILLLPIISPIMFYIAWLIKREEPDENIFFKQKRLGKDGKVFVCYKFRTMYRESDRILTEYLKNNIDETSFHKKYHKYKNDPRVTKVGRFLRRSSLDELPQIFNVLKGEMSLVGPRPYMTEERDKMGEYLYTISNVRPGITGLWQVSGRSDIDFGNRVKLDVWYIRNWSIWLDTVILLKTVRVVFTKEGAY